MNGDYSIFNNSMNGVITLSDGVSFISDGQAQHENVIYTNFIKSEDELTQLTNDTLETVNINATNLDVTNIVANSETLGTLTVTNLNVDNYGFFVDGFGNTISSSLPYTMNNSLKVVGNEFTLENGNINQIGTTSTNTLKTTSINGTLTCQSDLIQTGGNTVLKNITCDNVTMNNNKSITQAGSGISNSLGSTQISNLVVTTSMTFPASVTIPDAEQTGDLTFTGGARIIQDLTEAGTNYNTLMYSKIAKADFDGNIVQNSGTATLLNTVIQGTAEIQGNITQTAGQSVFKAIGCDQLSLTANRDIFFTNGTGRIDQSVASGTNLLNTITMNANRNVTQSGTGILSQTGTGTNALKNTGITGTLSVSSSTTLTGNVDIGGSLTFSANRSITQPTGTTNNQFQTTTISNLTCPTANITSLTGTSLAIGNVSNTEFQFLDGVVAPIQSQIDNINTTTVGNATALTGFTYTAGTDTTLIDNNVTISSGKNLLLGSTNVATSISSLNTSVSTINTNVSNLQTATTGITYTSGTDTTLIDNNVTIPTGKNLIVGGINVKAEIDSLETSFTTGTLNSTSLVVSGSIIGGSSISGVTVNASHQMFSPEFELPPFTYDASAIIQPKLVQGLGIGTGDGASYTTFNQALYSWFGTGFIDTALNTCKAFINHRTGDFSTLGTMFCNNIVVNTLATILSLVVTNIISTGFTVTQNTITSTTTSSSLGLSNVVVASFTVAPNYRRLITINSPVSLYRQYRNASVNVSLFNRIYDTLNSINFTINRNGSFYASGVCSYNNTIPNTTIEVLSESSSSSRNYEIYITNAICSFLPAISTTTDTYSVLFTFNATSDTSFQSFNFISESYGYNVNTTISTSTITPFAGSFGTNYQAYSFSSASNLNYVTNSSSVTTNDIISNNIFNQTSINTNNLLTNNINSSSSSINVLQNIKANPSKAIMSPSTYFGLFVIDDTLDGYKINKMYPIPCSLKSGGTNDDLWILCAGYKVVFYRNADYVINAGATSGVWSGSTDLQRQTRTIDNTDGTSYICVSSQDVYGSFNQVGSLKLYYQNTEITLPFFS